MRAVEEGDPAPLGILEDVVVRRHAAAARVAPGAVEQGRDAAAAGGPPVEKGDRQQ